ncbi:MAG: SAM-dependent methyltransferase [Chloroflexota bacterium]
MWWPPVVSLIVFIIVVSILWPQLRGAPWVPTTMDEVHKMLKMASVGENDVVYDLGCGDGRTVITAARHYGARAVGIEIDPLRYLWCQILITVLGLRGRVKIVFGDFFKRDLSEATVVTCYLLQSTNEKLEKKFVQELMPSSRIVSHDFTFPGLQMVYHNKKENLYLYHPFPTK